MRRLRIRRLFVSAMLLAGVLAATAGTAQAGPCYTVGVEDGSSDPPSATVCPWD